LIKNKIVLKKLALKELSLKKLSWLMVVVFVLLWIETTSSSWLWENCKLLQLWQFPWRWQLLLSVWILPIIVYVWQRVRAKLKVILAIILFLQILAIAGKKPVDRFHRTNLDYDAFAQTTTTQHENTPISFTYQNIGDWQPSPSLLAGEGVINVHVWNGSFRQYDLDLQTNSTIVEPTANFPGWRTMSDGKLVTYVDSEQIGGRIAYQLPAGQYAIQTKFYQFTWPRVVGNATFVMTSLFLVVAGLKYGKKKI